MRKPLALLLLFAVAALQLGSRWMVYASFKANQAYIEKNLCENKAKPEMECHGQCHLKKELQKTQEQERKAPKVLEVELAACALPEVLLVQGHASSWSPTKNVRWSRAWMLGVPKGIGTDCWQPPWLG